MPSGSTNASGLRAVCLSNGDVLVEAQGGGQGAVGGQSGRARSARRERGDQGDYVRQVGAQRRRVHRRHTPQDLPGSKPNTSLEVWETAVILLL